MPIRDVRLITRDFTVFAFPSTRVETSRGCTQGCKFCSINLMYGRRFRKFPIERVIDDIQDAESHGAGSIFFPGRQHHPGPQRLEQLCRRSSTPVLTHLRYKTQASASGIASSESLCRRWERLALTACSWAWRARTRGICSSWEKGRCPTMPRRPCSICMITISSYPPA